jgi:hypothetical protein
MARVHAPHRKAGYITDVAFEATTDRQGRPDWIMVYTPGPKARAEFRASQRGQVEVIEPPTIEPGPDPEATPLPLFPTEPTGLAKELADRGVTVTGAIELASTFPEDRIRAQIAAVDWLRANRPKKVSDPAAYLVKAIREDYAPPAGYRAQVERVEVEQQRAEGRAEQDRERAEEARIKAYLEGLTPERRAALDAEALAAAPPEQRAEVERQTRPVMRRMLMVPIREAYIRGLLGLASTG